MSEQEKRKAITKYFTSKPMAAIILLAIGGLFLLSGMASKEGGAGLIVFGVLLAGAGGGLLWMYIKGQVADSQIDAWLAEDLARLQNNALAKTGVAASQLIREQAYITGPNLWDRFPGVKNAHRKGKDRVIRYTPVSVCIVNFGKDHMFIYRCVLNFMTGAVMGERTDEYFYKDVVSVATSQIKYEFTFANRKYILPNAEAFSLTTSGATSVEVILRDPTLLNLLGGGILPTERAENAVQVIRTILRDKKSA